MNELIALAVKAIQAAIKYAPGLIEDLRKIFAQSNPTEADWQALHDKIASKSYEDYVPDSAIPKV
jgi:hypothetical protein